MKTPAEKVLVLAIVVALFSVAGTLAQGRTDYVNFESPPAHPIEVFRFGGHDFIAACNTRDNSIEIFDTDESLANRSLARVRVGLEPVSVRFNPGTGKLYSANFVGDSISVIGLRGGAGSLAAVLEQTTWVGDEPLDIAFYTRDPGDAAQRTLFVTHMALDGFDWRDALTLEPISGIEMAPALVTVGFDTSNPPNGVEDTFIDLAAKEPRAVLIRGDDLLILPLKGGSNSLDSANFDMDLWCGNVPSLFASPTYHGNLHTTGLNMSFDEGGTLYIVGGEALNETLLDEPNVMAAPTGFVKSMFYAIQDPCSQNPTVQRRDVNLAAQTVQQIPPLPLAGSGSQQRAVTQPATIIGPVKKSKALSMLTDVIAFEDGGLPKVFFTAFSNDRVGMVVPDPNQSDPNLWKLERIDVPPSQGNPLAGPRGLALRLADPETPNDPGDRLYVLNHLDASITTIDPNSNTIVAGTELALAVDPRPDYLTQGQQFLYNAKEGNGFNSCSTCHVDARLDRRRWDLGTPDDPPAAVPNILPDVVDIAEFPADKGFMMTQSLQGLLNSELAPQDQFWVTNAPYHWRGDRASFQAFNGAFVSLLGGAELEQTEIAEFEQYVNTIFYPPNPQQERDRQPSGAFGNAGDITSGSGGFRGLKIYHIEGTVGQRSCRDCHENPDGSNNRITEILGQPAETAAMRGLLQKEAKRDIDGSSDPKDSPYTGLEGLFHTGLIQGSTLEEFNLVASLNAFIKTGFTGELCPAGDFCQELQDLNQFAHEFDWSMGPMVGCPASVDFTNIADAYPNNPLSMGCDGACSDLASSIDCMEQQAATVDSGIAVQAWIGGQDVGFWYDAEQELYVEEPASGIAVDRAGLLDKLAGDDRAVFQAVPLGSERRVAAPSGIAEDLPAGLPKPSNLQFLPMVPSSMYERVPELTGAWAQLNNSGLESIFIHTVRQFQWGLIQDAASENGFGLGTALRHDAPRRAEVSGQNIRHGAYLALAYSSDPAAGPPNPALPLDQSPFQVISMPLYATPDTNPASGDPIWRTAIELEPLMYYGLMLGGPAAPGVAATYLDQKPFEPMLDPVLDQPFPGQFDPETWNFYYVFVVNTDGQIGDGGWQQWRIE